MKYPQAKIQIHVHHGGPPLPDEPVVIEAPPPRPNIIWPRLPPDHPYHLPPGYHYPDNLPEGHPGHYYPGMPPYPVIAP